MDEQVDVVIAGAGPAGCTAGALLARHGHRVVVLDRGNVPHPRLCTHAIMPAGLPVLAALGVLDQIEAAGAQRWWGVRLLLNGVEISASFPAHLGGAEVLAGAPVARTAATNASGHSWHDARYPFGLSLRRHLLDPILLGAVTRHPVVDVRLGWRVEGLLGREGVVTGVRVREAGGAVRRVFARLVVAADGRLSALARAARLPEWRLPSRHTALIAYVDGIPHEERPYLEGYYRHGRSASLLPADGGLRVAGVMGAAEQWERAMWGERLLAELRAYPGMRHRLRDARLVTDPVPVRGLRNLLRRTARPGFAVIGDAAAQTDPAFGQGIAQALRSGARLAEQADEALRRSDGPVTLSAHRAWELRTLALFPGISLLSAVPPGSMTEQIIGAAGASAPGVTGSALSLALRFV